MQRMVEGQQNGQQRVLPSCNLSLFFRFLCSHYHATIAAGLAAVHILRGGLSGGLLTISEKVTIWLAGRDETAACRRFCPSKLWSRLK